MPDTEQPIIPTAENDLQASGMDDALFSGAILHTSSALPYATEGRMVEHYSVIPPEVHWSHS